MNNQETLGPDHQLPAPDKAPKRSLGVRIFVWLVILIIFAAGFVWILRHKNASQATVGRRGAAGGTVAVTPATATNGDIGVYIDAIGTVTPIFTATITSQVNGIITEVHYREGQIVRKGDSLIDIDPRPYQATLAQAQGTLERDQNVLAQAKMDLARYQVAWSHNAIPKQTLDDQEKLVLQDEGTVKLDQGSVDYDQVQLGYCHIVAPVSGKAGLRLVDPGNVVQSNSTTPLVVITQMQPMTVVFTIPEDNLPQVQPHLRERQPLVVTAFDRGGDQQLAKGSLLTLDNLIDTTTGTVKARAVFANRDNALYPNQFVNTRLLVETLHNQTLLPTSAIQYNGTTAFVYVLENNVAHIIYVKPGVTDNNTTAVAPVKQGELKEGDIVANSSFDKLLDNAKVAISKEHLPETTSGSSAP
ncbi:efflux RND transporter periplasmic adaptor subunit [Acidicapsa dinghuensis]|uniref:Efflux RND transporter periplasmic adaptor subunit n=1 Tax=Acidicapsa dinghuensis TaxID=2218256 RepID=A0ABW1EQG7_9BACT|nr:efflux RND transporter periplasmic adaptor subunit [Acidicapsa dinghuensis]